MNVPSGSEGRPSPAKPPVRAYNARVLYSTSLDQIEKGCELFIGIRSLVTGPGVARPPTTAPAADHPPTAIPVINRPPTALPRCVRSMSPSPETARTPAADTADKKMDSPHGTGDDICTTSSNQTNHTRDNDPEPNTEKSYSNCPDSSEKSGNGEPPVPVSIPGSPGYTSSTSSSIPSHLSYVESPVLEAASDVPDGISEWSESSPVGESQAEGDDYGWSNIFTGTPEERRRLIQQLNELCERAEQEGTVLSKWDYLCRWLIGDLRCAGLGS